MKTNAARSVVQEIPISSVQGIQPRSAFNPIYAWATVGGLILALQLYVWIKWITGPYFTPVPTGVSEPPLWMQYLLIVWTSVICIGFPVGLYYFIIRPWRREKRITMDGMLMIAFGLTFFQDPFLDYTNTWCTYNTWLFNMGSWVQDIPGWLSWGQPGAMLSEPLLMNAPGYSYGLLLCVIFGCWFMRTVKKRWPNISTPGLLFSLFLFVAVFDVFMEGLFLMRMGLYVYPGAIQKFCLFPGHYYQFPVYEAIFYGITLLGFCSLRYFTDDRGQTFVERGLERVQGGFVKQQGLRFLALFAISSIIFFVSYNLPAQWLGLHADPWPEDIQKRSYFTSGICGEGTGRLCPDPRLPLMTNDTTLVDPDGNLVLPEGFEIPKIVPHVRGRGEK